ncbi:DNA topoisomerase 2-binding protein 1 [Lobosporangium transversale]|nr:DNA topoisomerase 2-binding protein 1 [Lobosporangium transversale]
MHGGKYTKDLLKDSTTHLICENSPTDKYTSALQWGIQCVTRKWFIDTLAKKERADESLYKALLEDGGKRANGQGAKEKPKDVNPEDNINDGQIQPPAEMFLEACQIFLCPSIPDAQVTRLKKMIRITGGIHVTEYDPQEVTHVLVPSYELSPSTLALFDDDSTLPYIVHMDWLRRSNRERRLLPESDYIVPFQRGEDGQPRRTRSGSSGTWTTDPAFKNKTSTGSSSTSAHDPTSRPQIRVSASSVSSNSSSNTIVSKETVRDPAMPADLPSTISPPNLSPRQTRQGLAARTVSGILSDALVDLSMTATTQRSLTTQENSWKLDVQPLQEEEEAPSSNIFLGLYITSYGCKAEAKIREETIANGGTYFDAAEGPPSEATEAQVRTIVPLSMSWEKAKGLRGVVMTICWFERSLVEERVIPRSDHFLFKPLRNIPVEGFEHLKISISASQMEETEYRHIQRTIKILGGVCLDKLHTVETDVLIADAPIGPKYEYMAKHGRPVVRMEWLKRCIEEGKAVPFKDFLLKEEEPEEMKTEVQDSPGWIQSENGYQNGESFRSNSSSSNLTQSQVQQSGSSNRPLAGLVICLPTRVLGDHREMQDMVTDMGARLIIKYNSTASHLIHNGKATMDAKRDLKNAKRNSAFIVSPEWLYKCDETRMRVDERDYPETYDGRHLTLATTTTHLRSPQDRPALAVLPSSRSTSPSQRSGKKTPVIGFGRAASTGYAAHQHGTGSQSSPTQTFQGTAAGALSAIFGSDTMSSSASLDISIPVTFSGPMATQQEGNGLSDSFIWQPMPMLTMTRSTNNGKRRRRPLPTPGGTQLSTTDMDHSGICETPDVSRDGSSIPENYFDKSSERYGEDAVYWVDVEGREKKRALLESLGYKTYKPIQREASSSRLEALSHDMEVQRLPVPRFYFMLTGISLVDRGQFKKTIQELGGVVLEDISQDHDEWKRKCTHLVTNGNNPPRTAKLVMAKVCGAIIVNKGFLVASREHGAFVDDTPFRVKM